MKRIRLLVVAPTEEQFKEVTANLEERDKQEARKSMMLNYKKLVQTVLRTPLDPRGGISIEEMEKSLKILKLVESLEDNGVLELEDTDWDYLVTKLDAVRWTTFDERLLTFAHTIKNATKDLLDEVQEDNRANGKVTQEAMAF